MKGCFLEIIKNYELRLPPVGRNYELRNSAYHAYRQTGSLKFEVPKINYKLLIMQKTSPPAPLLKGDGSKTCVDLINFGSGFADCSLLLLL